MPHKIEIIETGGHSPPVVAVTYDMDRAMARALTEAGMMPVSEYVRRYGDGLRVDVSHPVI